LHESDITLLAQRVLDRHDTPGAVVTTLTDGTLVSVGVGTADLNGTQPIDKDALFPIYSITKTYMAVAVMKLVESGACSLDDSVTTLVPDPRLDPAITLRQLLNHTSGLRDYGATQEYNYDLRRDPSTPWTTEDFLAHSFGRGPQFAPGTGWSYSNVGYLLVKLALERLAAQPFRDVIAEVITRPLGLLRTSVADTLADMESLTPGFSRALSHTSELEDIADRYHPGWVSHGLIISTTEEVARFLDALMNGRIVPLESLAVMQQHQRVPVEQHEFAREPSYGLGLMVDPAAEHGPWLGHTGMGTGYTTAAFHRTDHEGHQTTIVAFANRDHAEIGFEIAMDYLNHPFT
jgi:D-alanyl-D-alanine carboxypeptidase